MDELVVTLDKDISNIEIKLSKELTQSLEPVVASLPNIDIDTLLKSSGVKDSQLSEVQQKLKRSGLSTLDNLLSKQDRVTTGRTGLTEAQLKKFKSLTLLSTAAGSEKLGKKLVDSGFTSLAELGRLPYAAARARISGRLNKQEETDFKRIRQVGKSLANSVSDRVALHSQIASLDYAWLRDLKVIPTPTPPRECNCSDCNVFSPNAYLLSIIEMLNDHWELSVDELEKITGQDIDTLDCSSGDECFTQIELAVEVLQESSRTKIHITDNEFKKNFETIWARLLIESETLADKAINELRQVGLSATDKEKKLIELMRDPLEGLKSIRTIRDQLNAVPKLTSFKQTSSLYADEDSERFSEALEQSYLQAVKLYRDALISSTNLSVEFLQKELFLDLKSGSCKKSNRIAFLILALQTLILSGRTGQLKNITNPDINSALKTKLKNLDSIPLEELSWKWLKDYKTWLSAMVSFLYPENSALPFLYDKMEKYQHPIGIDDFKLLSDTLLASPQDRFSVIQNIINYYTKFVTPERRSEINFRIINGETTSNPIELISRLDEKITFGGRVSVKDFMNALPHYAGYLFYSSTNNPIRSIFDHAVFSGVIHKLHIPITAAFVLNKSERYESAHEWYQQLYDPTKIGDQKYGIDFDNIFDGSVTFSEESEDGIIEPNALLHRRHGAMLRHVVIMMVKNLLDWADHEFAKSTTSSIDRARQLYELAKVTLDAPDLRDHCGESLRELTILVVDRYSSKSELIEIIERLKVITDRTLLEKAIADIEKELNKDGNPNIAAIERIVTSALKKFDASKKPNPISNRINKASENRGHLEVGVIKNSVKEKGFADLLVDNSRSSTDDESILNDDYFPSSIATTFCVPPNPFLVQLDKYIELSLLKIQLCLDISGEPLASSTINYESAAEFFDALNLQYERQPLANLPASGFNKPPRYRYLYLVEKARQYTDVAQRIGNTLFTAYQGRDSQRLAILNAHNAIEIASSTVDLKNLGLRDAQLGLEIAELQFEKATDQFNFWDTRVYLSEEEKKVIQSLENSELASKIAAAAQSIGLTIGSGNPDPLAALDRVSSAASTNASAFAASASLSQTKTSFERRNEDWDLQKLLSEFDSKIADIQKSSAANRVDVADAEMGIAKLQHSQSSEVLTFLENQFSNTQLYEWMISVLSQNYRTLMQISSNTAKLAQQALEFERQESLSIISGDYWSINSAQGQSLSDEQKESGTLGAERLITDLTRLDAYKLSSEVRRQQISKSISFAQILPNELITLKTTGKVTFNTLMNWFDRDYPGNYHRLIKGIKITMLALTPPTDGIHGSLSNSGESTVVINNDLNQFESIRAFRRFDERITLDSPFNETGLFVFDYNDPMFLPFEGLGVETQWTLELPKAANRFNFDTLVDVILTIDYTALHSDSYAQEIKNLLGNTDNNDITIQPRLQTPDSWYHFINDPLDANGNRVLPLDVSKEYLPAHYIQGSVTKTHHVSLVALGDFSGLNNAQLTKLKKAITVEHTYKDGSTTKTIKLLSTPPAANPSKRFNTNSFNIDSNSLFLTTRSSSSDSFKLSNPSAIDPIGEWKLVVNDDLGLSKSFGELVSDILLIVTTEGDVDWG